MKNWNWLLILFYACLIPIFIGVVYLAQGEIKTFLDYFIGGIFWAFAVFAFGYAKEVRDRKREEELWK